MATTQPEKPAWFLPGGGTEPSSGEKSAGFSPGDRPPSGWWNWFMFQCSLWARWWGERFFDGGDATDFVVQAANDEGGTLRLLAGDAPNTSDTNGGTLALNAGSSRGSGYSQLAIKAAVAGTTGTAERVPENFLVCDGSTGNIVLYKKLSHATQQTLIIDAAANFLYNSSSGGPNTAGRGVDCPGNTTTFFEVILPYTGTIVNARCVCAAVTNTVDATLYLGYRNITSDADAAITTNSNSNASISTSFSAQLALTSTNLDVNTTHTYWLWVLTAAAETDHLQISHFEFDVVATDWHQTRFA